MVNPGVAIANPAIATAHKNGVEVTGDIELFAKEVGKYNAKVVGITGSNGKSTCVSLLHSMAENAGLNVKLGGNIGTPALDLLGDTETELFILELSSFQLETTTSLDCDVASIINVSPDHLDRYPNYQAYIDAKTRLLNKAQKLVVFADDEVTAHLSVNGEAIKFTLNEPKAGEYGIKNDKLYCGDKALIATEDILLQGKHNYANALACLAIGDILKIPLTAMLKTLREFKGLKHRAQLVATINGTEWINDSKATNVGATIASINSFANSEYKNIILIAGGQTKGAELTLLKEACRGSVASAILYGEDAKLIEDAIKSDSECYQVADLKAACKLARKLSTADNTVLFAPAGASFDMFDNYQARGDAFIEIVGAMQ